MTNWFRPRRYAVRRLLSRWRFGPHYALLFGLLLVLAGPTANQGDLQTWVNWTTHIFRRGLGNAYESLPLDGGLSIDYNPLYLYVLWLFGRVLGSAEAIQRHIHGLKAFTLAFDFAGALLAASLLRGVRRRFRASLLLLLNVGYLYNTLVWQQVDTIFAGLTLAALVLALRQRPGLSLVLYVLALNAKLQAIMFLPPLLLLWLPLWRRAGLRWWLGGLAAAGAVQALLLAPFIWGGDQNYLPRILANNFGAVGTYPYVSVHAYNVWVLLMPHALAWTSDALVKFGLTYKAWGLLAFFGASFVVLLPLLLAAGRRFRAQATLGRPDAPLVLLTFGLIALLFCYFNTQMHERYWHPAILFLGAYALRTRHFGPYVLASVAYFLNLQAVFRLFDAPLWPVHNPHLVASLFTLALLTGTYRLYREYQSPPPTPLFGPN